MTLQLELAPETENRLRSEADRRGQTLEAFALTQLERVASPSQSDRRARLARLCGSVKGDGPTVDEFLAERQAEARAEAEL